jgi:nitric oxide reductase NorD protein
MAPDALIEWDQGLFRAGRALWRRLRGAHADGDAAHAGHAARLEEHRAALTALARCIAGVPVRIVEASDAGGVRGLDLLLPREIDTGGNAETHRDLYVLRVAVGAALVRGAAQAASPDRARAIDAACAWLAAELPAFPALLERARALAPDDVLFGTRIEAAPLAPAGGNESGAARAGTDAPTSEAEAPRVGSIEQITLEKDERGDILWNPFERVETLDEYRGGSRNLDGADDLEGHLEALAEVDLGKVTRDGGPARSLLRADVHLDADAPEVATTAPSPGGIPYDEWDFRTRRHRPGWCTVYPERVQRADPRWAADAATRHRRRILELARRLEHHRAGLRSVDRQLDGEDVDLAALVDERAAVAAGFGGNPRLYTRQERRRRDFATTVLLDVSLSTDAWIRGRRVLDVARDAVFVLGEVATLLGDRIRVLAFSSETRNRCHVWDVLGWDEPWQAGRARLGALEPTGYTRIGPAIRHATADLAAVAAERKLLLLVSDGKPTDFDRYEGRYGIADVRQSLREAEQRGLRAHALAVDAVAREWLPALFGAGAWHVLPRPDLLADVLTEVYGRLTLGSR